MNDQHEEDLPVAMPLMAGFFGGNDLDHNDDNDEAEWDNIHHHVVANAHIIPDDDTEEARRQLSATSYLHGMIQDPETACSYLLRQQRLGCHQVVERIRQAPDDVFFVERNGRTPLHEATLRCSCIHIVSELLNVHSRLALATDRAGNTPLHLLLVGATSRSLGRQEMSQMLCALMPSEKHPPPPPPPPPPQRRFDSDNSNNNNNNNNRTRASILASIGNRDGNTPLHLTCLVPETMIQLEHFQTILASNPASASRLNVLNQTPLSLHCQRRNASVEVAKLLCQSFPQALGILDTASGFSPLHYACYHANHELIQYLLSQALNTSTANKAASLRTTTQLETPLHLLCRKHTITEEYLPVLEQLLQADPEAIVARDASHGYTPLHWICRSPHSSCRIVQSLLRCNAAAASIGDNNFYLPLHHACEMGAPTDVISCLLQANNEAATAVTKKGDSALTLACACNTSTDTVVLLIQANPNALTERNLYGYVPLHCVCGSVQPRVGIVQTILEANPDSVTMKNYGGETPMHIASGNPSASVGVIALLAAQHDPSCAGHDTSMRMPGAALQENYNYTPSQQQQPMINKVGNTPLHHACFRGSPFEHIETLAISNPQWVKCLNNAGYTALQIMSKNGGLYDRVITLFSRIGGPGVFSVVDLSGNTPLHSAMREETDIEALRCLIRAYPDALSMKTLYGDTPLHLATTRRVSAEMVREIAISGDGSLLLTRNTSCQTPMSIAMEDFELACKNSCAGCRAKSHELQAETQRAFNVLATLVKILAYGSKGDRDRSGSLVQACMSLHRQNVRLDPAFILRALHLYPEEARLLDQYGNTPLHLEASIPVEKMSLLSSSASTRNRTSCGCHDRTNILRALFDIYPAACQVQNHAGEFPLSVMIQNGRAWDQTFALILRAFPEALHWSVGVNNTKMFPLILSKVAVLCGSDTLFALIHSRPDIAAYGNTKKECDRNHENSFNFSNTLLPL